MPIIDFSQLKNPYDHRITYSILAKINDLKIN